VWTAILHRHQRTLRRAIEQDRAARDLAHDKIAAASIGAPAGTIPAVLQECFSLGWHGQNSTPSRAYHSVGRL
jgi:hypothetical protein